MPKKREVEKELISKVISDSRSISALNKRLTDEIISNRNVIRKLSTDISKLKIFVNKPDETIPRREFNSLKQSNRKLLEKIDGLNKQLKKSTTKSKDELVAEIEKRNHQLGMMGKDIIELNELYKNTVKENNRLHLEIEGFRKKLSDKWDIHEELEHKKKSIYDLNNKVNILKNALASKDSTSQEFLKAISTLKNSADDTSDSMRAKDELLRSKDIKIELLKKQLKTQEELLSIKTHHTQEYETSFEDMKKDLEKNYDLKIQVFEKNLVEKENIIDELSKKLNLIEKDNEVKFQKIKEKHSHEIELLNKDINKIQKSNQDFEKELTILKENLSRKADLLKTMSVNLTKKDTLLKTIEDNRNKIESSIAAKDKQLKLAEDKLKGNSKKMLALNSNIVTLKEDLKAVEEINKDLMKKLGPIDITIKEYKDLLKKKEEELLEKDSYYPMLFEIEKLEFQDKMDNVIKDYTEREIHLNMEIEKLNEVVKDQQSIINEIKQKYMWFANQFRTEFGEVLKDMDEKISYDQDLVEEAESEEIDIEVVKDHEKIMRSKEEGDEHAGIEEIVPMIDVALQHGDSMEQIKQSLKAANYSDLEIDKAIKKLKNN